MGSRIRENPERLFECFLEVVAPTETVKEPWVLQQYPSNFNNKEILQSVGRFAYPCDVESSSTVQHFSYVLTNIDGKWTFGFCRHAPNGLTCICILSFIPWHETFYKLLDRIAEITHHRAESELEGFLEALYKSKIPTPGSRLRVAYDLGTKTFEVNCPDHLKLPSLPENRNLFEYYSAVDVTNMIIIFASMLNERRVLITSSRLSRLSACIQAASALLYPMHWQHIFIPVLPIQLIDYLSAPMPFLIGVPLPVFARARRSEMGDVVILHADKNRVESPFDDLQSLPLDIATTLRRRLKNPDTMRGDGVARVFLNALVQLIGGYRDALRFKEGEKITFCSKTFIQTRPAHMQPYLDRMLHLQIFQQFIEERLDILNSRKGFSDIFEEEVNFYADKGGAKFKTQYKEWMGNFRKEGGALLRTVKNKANPAVKHAYKHMKDRSKKAYKEMRSMFQETPSKELKYSPSSSMEGMPQPRSAPASPTLVRPVTVHGTKLSRSSSQQKSVISYVRQKDGPGGVNNNNVVVGHRRIAAVNGHYETPKTSVQYSPLEVGVSPTESRSIVESDERSESPDLSMRRISMDLMGDLQDIIFRKCSLTDSSDLRESPPSSSPKVTVLAPPVDRSLKPQLSPPINSVTPTEVKSPTISHPLPPPRTKRHHTLKPEPSPKMDDTPLIRLDSDDSDVVFDPLLDTGSGHGSASSGNLHYTSGQSPSEFAGSVPLSGAHHVTAVASLNNPVYYQVRPVQSATPYFQNHQPQHNPFSPASMTTATAPANRMSVNGNTFYLHGRNAESVRTGTASPTPDSGYVPPSDNIDVRNYFIPKPASPNSFIINNNHHLSRDAMSVVMAPPSAALASSPPLPAIDHFRLVSGRGPPLQNATLPPSFPSTGSHPPQTSFLHSNSHPRLPMSSGVSVSQRVKLYEDTSSPSPPNPWGQKVVGLIDPQQHGGQHHHHNRSQTLPEQRKQWQTFE